MTFYSDIEEKVAIEIEDLKKLIFRKEEFGINTRFEREKLECLRFLYGELMWQREPNCADS